MREAVLTLRLLAERAEVDGRVHSFRFSAEVFHQIDFAKACSRFGFPSQIAGRERHRRREYWLPHRSLRSAKTSRKPSPRMYIALQIFAFRQSTAPFQDAAFRNALISSE